MYVCVYIYIYICVCIYVYVCVHIREFWVVPGGYVVTIGVSSRRLCQDAWGYRP